MKPLTQRTNTEDTIPRTEPVDACPVCGSRKSSREFVAADRLHGIPGKFEYRRCSYCRTVFQAPRVVASDISLLYPTDYHTHDCAIEVVERNPEQERYPRAPRSGRNKLRQEIIEVVQGSAEIGRIGLIPKMLARSMRMRERAFRVADSLIPRRGQSKRALDVGCGAGQLLISLRDAGWDAEGIEMDAQASEIASRVSGAKVTNGDFQSVALPTQAFGLIVLSHVIEHLADPVAVLRRVKQLLAPGGRVVLYYPNPDSIGARLYGDSWFPWEVPRHLVIAPRRAFLVAAQGVGLVPVRSRTLSRNAEGFSANSRSYKAGRQVNEFQVTTNLADKLIAVSERLLCAVGLNVGEELEIVLERERDA